MALWRFIVIFASLHMCHLPVQAQTGEFVLQLIQMDQAYENKVKERAPNYRLIRRIEPFPDRFNATKKIMVSSKPEQGIASLHDVQTGQPLESCQMPCSLHVNPNLNYFVEVYKFGYVPAGRFVSTQTQELDIWLGTNYLKVFKQHQDCRKEFQDRTRVDRDAEPCVRVPAMMPSRAEKSGHCKMTFDVNNKGKTEHISAVSCTDPIFKSASISSVKHWFYYPKVERGQMVTQRGVETTVRFKLSDENGNLIPEE